MSDDRTTAEHVVAFLRAHPAFFGEHADLLADLTIPHEKGAAVSLVERQVGVLRERNVELRERLNGLLSVARDNDLIFEKTRTLVLTLLEANDFSALTNALSKSLLGDFGMVAMSVILFDARVDASTPHLRCVDGADAETRMGGLLKGRRVVCGVLRPEELGWAFGADADAVGSAAIVPLVFHGQLGLLAIGARDPQHFKSGLDTLFVGHIGDVLARRVYALMPAAEQRARSGA